MYPFALTRDVPHLVKNLRMIDFFKTKGARVRVNLTTKFMVASIEQDWNYYRLDTGQSGRVTLAGGGYREPYDRRDPILPQAYDVEPNILWVQSCYVEQPTLVRVEMAIYVNSIGTCEELEVIRDCVQTGRVAEAHKLAREIIPVCRHFFIDLCTFEMKYLAKRVV